MCCTVNPFICYRTLGWFHIFTFVSRARKNENTGMFLMYWCRKASFLSQCLFTKWLVPVFQACDSSENRAVRGHRQGLVTSSRPPEAPWGWGNNRAHFTTERFSSVLFQGMVIYDPFFIVSSKAEVLFQVQSTLTSCLLFVPGDFPGRSCPPWNFLSKCLWQIKNCAFTFQLIAFQAFTVMPRKIKPPRPKL